MRVQRVDARVLTSPHHRRMLHNRTEMRHEVGKVLCELEKILRQVGKALYAILESPVHHFDATDSAIG